MAREFAKSFYNSSIWKKCRAGYIASVFNLCEKCGQMGYIVHHKIHLTPENIDDTDITLNWNNLEYLCLDCHNKEHEICTSNEDIEERKLLFDADGNLIGIEDRE